MSPRSRVHKEQARQRDRNGASTSEPGGHPVLELQRLAGNAAVTTVVQRDRGDTPWTFSPVAPTTPDLRLSQATIRKTLEQEEGKRAAAAEAAAPKVKAWLESHRADIEGRANSTRMGLISDPKNMVTVPKLIHQVRQAVPEATAIDDAAMHQLIKDWAGFDIVEVALKDGQVPLDQVHDELENILGTPGKVKVDRRGDDFLEVNLESVQITDGPGQVSAFYQGGVGLQIQPRENVAGSFQLNADGTWKAQLIFGKNATEPIVSQMYNVMSAGRGAMREIASSKDQSILQTVSGPVKDAVDTLNSICSKEQPRVSFGVQASGGPGGGVAVEAALTVRF